MNARTTIILLGTIIFGLGLIGLVFPEFAMSRVLGFEVAASHARNAVLGEVRATYGGLFVAMGLWTLLAALDPVAHRSRLQFIGILWLGVCAGRLVGASFDGDPGVMGWVAVAFEAVMGGLLIVVPYFAQSESQSPAAPQPVAPPAAHPFNPPAGPTEL